MNTHVKQIGAIAIGWAFIVLGIIGLFLPFLQGILFLLIGLLILSTEYVWAHKLLQKVRTRFPKIAAQMDRAREYAERFVKKKDKAEGA